MKIDLSEKDLLRYSRQIMLPKFDVAGQLALANARVLIIGLGGLGCPAALYLSAAGVGSLDLADFDDVEYSNLQRQILHRESSVGKSKVRSAEDALNQINSNTTLRRHTQKLSGEALLDCISEVDLVLDCTDNFDIRFEINHACVATKTPLVSGAAIRMEGQVSVFDARDPESPCYQCLYPPSSEQQLSCSESGIMAPITGIIGSVQAMEAIKLLAHLGEPLIGKLLVLDGMRMEWRSLNLKRDVNCLCCSRI